MITISLIGFQRKSRAMDGPIRNGRRVCLLHEENTQNMHQVLKATEVQTGFFWNQIFKEKTVTSLGDTGKNLSMLYGEQIPKPDGGQGSGRH